MVLLFMDSTERGHFTLPAPFPNRPCYPWISPICGVASLNGSLFCRAPDRSSDLRDDEEEWASIYGRFCPRGAANLPCPDLVFQDESEPRSRSDYKWIAAGAHADFDLFWPDLFLCRAGTLRRHADAPALARRRFTQSGGAIDDGWLVFC